MRLAFSVLPLLILAAPASAEHWFIMQSEGVAPSRTLFLMDVDRIEDRDGLRQATIAVLNEADNHPNGAQQIDVLAFDCAAGTASNRFRERRDAEGGMLGMQSMNATPFAVNPDSILELFRLGACEDQFDITVQSKEGYTLTQIRSEAFR